MKNRAITRFLLVISAALCLAACGYAQQQTAELTGQITDSSGAVVPGAMVTISNSAHGIKVKVTSNSSGIYIAPLLPPADDYEITVSKAGYQQLTRSGVTLQVAQTATVNLSLAVGSSNETVVVTGAPPLLDAQTSSVGQVIEARTIRALPLNGRSSFRLIQLTPGVTFNQGAYGQFGDVPVNTTWDTSFSVDGGQAQSNEILIDGVPSEVGFFNQITTIPNVDDTEEFKVESNNLSAEYGRFAGGVINVTTKSGTNQLHGTAFEFLRNSALDANDYFNNLHGKNNPPLKMNQYGGVLGGPVVLPHLYDGRNKTFFFGDYQGTSRIQGTTFLTTVPTAAERTGDFSKSGFTIYDPATTKPDPNNPGHYIRNQFSGNVIPSDRIDPVAKALISYYPLPNTTGSSNYISNASMRVGQNSGSARVDQNVNDHYHFFGRFGWLLTDLTQPNTFGNVATGGPGAVGTTTFHNWSFAFDNTITISPTLLLTVNYGYARWFQARQTLSYGFDNAKLGFPSQFVSLVTIPMFPSIHPAGYGAMNGQSYLSNGNDTHALIVSLTKILGRHTLIAGADVRMHLINFFNVGSAAGTFNFAAAQTQGPDPNKAVSGHGDSIASLLLGFGSGGSMPIGAGTELRDWYMATYLQDNYRATNRLTLNLGLRYGTESPYTDRHNRLNYFNPNVPSPARNPSFPNLTGGLLFAGVGGAPDTVYDWNIDHFEPRLGFAYSVRPSTVVRGGAGLVYAPLEISDNAVGFTPTTGFSSITNWVTSVDGGLTPFNLLSNPYPQGLVSPTGASLGAATALGQSISVWTAHPKTPLSYQWNFGIQQQLPSAILVEAAYVASHGEHLTHNFNYDALNPQYLSMGSGLQTKVSNPFQPFVSIGALSQPTVTQEQLLLPFPQFIGLNAVNETWGDSTYESAQFKVNKRTTHGVSMLAVYTISKWLSDVTVADAPIGPTNNTGVQNWYDLRAEKSLSENDIPQALILNVVAELPFGRGQRYLGGLHGPLEKLIGGWRVSGILTEQKGQPLVFSAPDVGPGNRPNWVSGVNPKLSSSRPDSQKIAEYFNKDAFSLPLPWQFGNVPRTTGAVRGPGVHNLDLSLVKQTQMFERLKMEFRAEAFNLTNTPHFGLPDTNMAHLNTTFGQITGSLASPPAREIQFALKLRF